MYICEQIHAYIIYKYCTVDVNELCKIRVPSLCCMGIVGLLVPTIVPRNTTHVSSNSPENDTKTAIRGFA